MLAACAALLLRAPAPAPAFCSCAGPSTDASAVRYNTVVFEGRPIGWWQALRPYGRVRVYTFVVTRWRKGMPRRTVAVETGLGGGDCGVVCQRGRTYTVYASRYGHGRLGTDICSGPYLPDPAPPPALPRTKP
jgi:hypothetical protein